MPSQMQKSVPDYYQFEQRPYQEDPNFMDKIRTIWRARPLWQTAQGTFYGQIYDVEIDQTRFNVKGYANPRHFRRTYVC